MIVVVKINVSMKDLSENDIFVSAKQEHSNEFTSASPSIFNYIACISQMSSQMFCLVNVV